MYFTSEVNLIIIHENDYYTNIVSIVASVVGSQEILFNIVSMKIFLPYNLLFALTIG